MKQSFRYWMERLVATLLCMMLLAPAGSQAQEPLRIVTTVFPAFDFARQVAGDAAQVSMLIPPGADSHSYEPSPRDLMAIQNADLFIYTGGESDTWLERILESMGGEAPCALRMADAVVMLPQEHTASMHSDHVHADGEICSDEDHHHEHAHQEEMDEHVWTSPKNALLILRSIEDELCRIRPEDAALFRANSEAYAAQIERLDRLFEETVAAGQRRLIVFGDRFPMRYFAAAYGLAYDAAFPGCSEDSEPSVRTVISLVDTIRREGVPVVFHIEYSSQKTARILAEETGAEIRLFHSCHTVSYQEIEQGATYVTLMEKNVEVLKEALNGCL